MRERDFLKIVVDLDGTILEERAKEEKSEAIPLPGAVEAVNKLYEMGHVITIYSARDYGELDLTVGQLNKYGVKYHHLVMGKPVGDIFIDDRAFHFNDWGKDWFKLVGLISEKMKQPYKEKDNCSDKQS